MSDLAPEDVCPDCGAMAPGGRAGCQAIFEEVLIRDYSDPAYFTVHRLMVDVYALQHPEPYCHSAKSLAAHLTGLCWALEYGADPAIGQALKRWLDGAPSIEKIEPPEQRGDVTIAAVWAASGPAAHSQAVNR